VRDYIESLCNSCVTGSSSTCCMRTRRHLNLLVRDFRGDSRHRTVFQSSYVTSRRGVPRGSSILHPAGLRDVRTGGLHRFVVSGLLVDRLYLSCLLAV